MANQAIDGSLTAEQLRAVLDYNPRTGVFTWKPRAAKISFSSLAGQWAGCYRKPDGYLVIRINNQLYKGHRLAVLWMTGQWPAGEVDHRDHDPRNNKWRNLRIATSSQNKMSQRTRSDNTSGHRGVWFENRRQHWVAEIMANGIKYHLGSFPTAEEAKAARDIAARRLHGKFARVG